MLASSDILYDIEGPKILIIIGISTTRSSLWTSISVEEINTTLSMSRRLMITEMLDWRYDLIVATSRNPRDTNDASEYLFVAIRVICGEYWLPEALLLHDLALQSLQHAIHDPQRWHLHTLCLSQS